jgi:hypothetical protein
MDWSVKLKSVDGEVVWPEPFALHRGFAYENNRST